MSATEKQVEDLQSLVIILGGTVTGLVVVSIIILIISLFCVSRLFKKLNDISFTVKSARLDIRKTMEAVESANKRNHALIIDEDDGSERVSPIFTRKMFTPSPLPFDFSALKEADYSYESRAGRKSNNPNYISPSNARIHSNAKGPAVPPRRAHSFYGDY